MLNIKEEFNGPAEANASVLPEAPIVREVMEEVGRAEPDPGPTQNGTNLNNRLEDSWVCCDSCGKWRRVPQEVANSLDEHTTWWVNCYLSLCICILCSTIFLVSIHANAGIHLIFQVLPG